MSMIQLSNFEMYYKKEGSGEPIILLHGNNESSKIFDKLIKKLSKNYLVYALDTRGHGKSTGSYQDFHYDQFAEDLKAFIDAKKIKNVLLYGFSDGGITALIFTLKYPAYVKKLMLSGVNIFPKGIKSKDRFSFWWKAKFSKSLKDKALYQLMLDEPNLNFEQLSKIQVPTLLTIGKKDVVYLKHALEMKKAIPNSELIVVTNANHYNYICNSTAIGTILINFLTNRPQK